MTTLRRSVKVQLVAFAAVSAIGITYVGVNYVGLGQSLVGDSYTVSADFPDSGGIFTNAEVTYRGVQVGRVGELRLLPGGVRVDLVIDDGAPPIPADSRAVVTNRSAVGEQYVDLQPEDGDGPYLDDGAVLAMDRNRLPIATHVLLLNLDRLVNSVDRNDLTTVIDELGTAFVGTGPQLQDLLDRGSALLADAREALPETVQLIQDSQTVLATQVASGSAIQDFSRDLNLLTRQLRTSDPDLRSLLAVGPPTATELTDLLTSTRTDLGVLLGNLDTVSQLTVRRVAGLEQVLVTYPGVVAGGFTVAPGDGTAHFGLVINLGDPQSCTAGYGGTPKRVPADTSDTPANTAARCDEPRGSDSSVRGAQNAPRAGVPAPPSIPGASGPPTGPPGPGQPQPGAPGSPADPLAGLPILGSTGGEQDVLGDRSWLTLLTTGLSG